MSQESVGGFLCPREYQHFCHKRMWLLEVVVTAHTDTLPGTAFETICHCPPSSTDLFLCPNKAALGAATMGLYVGSLGELVSRRSVSSAKDTHRSISPAEWEMTCSRKPITCSVYFALAKKLLYLSARRVMPCLRRTGGSARWPFVVGLLARFLLQLISPSLMSSACGCYSFGSMEMQTKPGTILAVILSKSWHPFPRREPFISLVADLVLWSSREERSRGSPAFR